MDPALVHLIEALHQVPFRYVLALAGGGSGSIAALLTVPGGSRTILEVAVPYEMQSLTDYLGRRPENFCSLDLARTLAERAQARANWLAPGETVAGVGACASLATVRPKRGGHRFHLAVSTDLNTTTRSLVLAKGARSRSAEEAVLDAVLLNLLAEAFGASERIPVNLLAGEVLQEERVPKTDAVTSVLQGILPTVCIEPDGRVQRGMSPPPLLVPGAFNPIHEGHWGLGAVASQLTGKAPAFELSVTNVDKPPLTPGIIRQRLNQFSWRAPVWLTTAPTFVEKAQLFPGTLFAVGVDTAARIVAPRYYQDSTEQRDKALNSIRERGCRFLVASRIDDQGKLLIGEDIVVPAAQRDLFVPISADVFRVDLSSTALRNQEAL
jgi:hypothetical protein